MALVTTKDMFAKAINSDYAIGAFNVNNMEIIQGIVEAAQLEDAPLILQVSAGCEKIRQAGLPDQAGRSGHRGHRRRRRPAPGSRRRL